MVYIGAENIVSPLGQTALENFDALLQNKSGVRKIKTALENKDIFLSVVGNVNEFDLVEQSIKSINDSLTQIDSKKISDQKVSLIVSTTKGEIQKIKEGKIAEALLPVFADNVANAFPWIRHHQVVSNACVSGVLAIVMAHDLIENGDFETVIVCGADLVSDFTISGFLSFFAISDVPCRPFDKNRTGINLGEGVATLILSKDPSIFKNQSFKCLGGSSANDANHISGPSRTGEGLYRSIIKSLRQAQLNSSQIDFLSAHGTGTLYNDEMESIAFERAGLSETPLHSLKGYYGHTFGAAGLIESAICLQSMRANKLIASKGFEEIGTSKEMNVLRSHLEKSVHTIMKTASGFGGCNASVIFQK
jgi:3-oxoacyl-[acyl-carrier-protein] synthase-1